MDVRQLFDQFFAQDSVLILLFLLVAFLLGFLTAYLLQSGRIRRISAESREKDAKVQHLASASERMEEELSLKEADLKRAAFELEESKTGLQRQADINKLLQADLQTQRGELDKCHASNQHYLSTIEDLNDQILGLKARLNQLTEQPVPASGTSEPVAVPLESSSVFTPVPGAEDRLAAIEERLRTLEDENEQLRQEMAGMKTEGTSTESAGETSFVVPAILDTTPEEEPEPDLSRGADVVAPNAPATPARSLVKDDLTLIDGIGPFLEKKLNDIGIVSFEQISQFDHDKIAEVTRDIQFFEGRIEKDDWVGQAKRLLEARGTQPAPAPAPAEATPEAEDDLKIIEGIGPAIETILKNAGIRTFAELAQSDPDEMESILQVVDPRMRVHDAGTWPAQARLAMNNEWEVLKDYQEQLRAGRQEPGEDQN